MGRTRSEGTEIRAIVAGVLAWFVPGAGHFFLGERWRGSVFLAVITVTFWCGVAVGGVRSTVDPVAHKHWFLAEMLTGSNTIAALALSAQLPRTEAGAPSPYLAVWPADDIGIVYCGVAGLLNLLVVIDAVARGAQWGPRPGAARPPPGGGSP